MLNSFAKNLIKSRMKDLPEEEKEKFFKLVEENPEFFQKIVTEIQSKIARGTDKAEAVYEVINQHKEDLKGLDK